jgi:HK97 family phage prohead protease
MKPKLETLGQEHCSIRFALTEANPEVGTFKGVASVFGSRVDSWIPTVIEHGAFTKTLKENGARVKLLWQHDISEPIGLPTSLAETMVGLEVAGKISQTTRGKDAIVLTRDGVIDELSIGFDPIVYNMERLQDGSEVRHITELRLWEISLVSFAADPLAKIHTVHSVVPFQDLPLADEARAWSAAQARARVKTACGLDGDNPDWAKFKKAHVWYDGSDAEKMGSYKLLIADMIDGKMTAIPRGIFAAAVAVQGGRGGLNVPDNELAGIKSHLGRYYKKLDRTAPWDAEKDSIDTIIEMLACMPLEAHEGKVLSAKNKKLLADAVAALQALIAAAEPPAKDESQALTVDAELQRKQRELELILASV